MVLELGLGFKNDFIWDERQEQSYRCNDDRFILHGRTAGEDGARPDGAVQRNRQKGSEWGPVERGHRTRTDSGGGESRTTRGVSPHHCNT